MIAIIKALFGITLVILTVLLFLRHILCICLNITYFKNLKCIKFLENHKETINNILQLLLVLCLADARIKRARKNK